MPPPQGLRYPEDEQVIDDLPEPTPARFTARQVRDLLAVVLMLLGLAGFVACAFMWNVLAGAALTCLLVAGVGIVLGLDR